MRQVKYKFQRLKVYHLALDYVDRIYRLARELPGAERFNLCSQLERAATSIVLNIAEGSTGQSDAEQNRFLGLALRSYMETIACLDIIEMRSYLTDSTLAATRELGHELFIKLQSFRKALRSPVASPRSPVPGPRFPVPSPQSPVPSPQSPTPREL